MQALRPTTSPLIFLVSTPSNYHVHLQLGSALKHTLNHDITRCLSSRDRKKRADEDIRGISRESAVFQNVFQSKQAPVVQKLSETSRVQTIKFHNRYQTKHDELRSVQNITELIVENPGVSENKAVSEPQESARPSESPLVSSQMLSDQSGNSKDKIDEDSKRRRKSKVEKKPTGPNLSLLEELFPEEFGQAAAPDAVSEGEGEGEEVIPRLPLVDFDDEEDFYNYAQNWKQSEDSRIGRSNVKDALHEWDLAVLVVNRASKSLIESDFRRLIPRGQHIDEWRGPGDILKVIPARNQSTLRQAGHYFLIFPNSAYAQAFQSHVVSLHRIARAHTPTSIESPMSPPPGMLVDGEDVYSVLQTYALCPPSQKISLRVVYPPYSAGLKRLLELRGYPQIMKPEDKSCKLVLFWVDGFQPTIHDIKDWITSDEDNRGLSWALANSTKSAVEKVGSAAAREWDEGDFGATEPAETSRFRGLYPRYLIHFADEDEARRFIRAWHRRPFPLPNETLPSREPPPLVHAELVW